MTLFSNDSTILEEVPIDYENKVAIYDDYCDELYAIKKNDNHETCHLDFNFQLDYASHDSYFVEFAPTHKIPMHRKWVRLKCASHILHDALFMFQFLSFMRASLKSSCLARGVKR